MVGKPGLIALVIVCWTPGIGFAEAEDPETRRSESTSASVCLLVELAAKANHLPVEFFARVIWQESRFQADAVGPRTRSGDRAQGIAQFMPRTAAERGLLDPFDPIQALPESAKFLAELRSEFGNLGLAAAAYNAGPQRLRDYLAGKGGMPSETRSYVLAITGVGIDDWIKAADAARPPTAIAGCQQLVAMLKQAPNPFVRELEQRIELVAAAPWGVELSAGFSREKALRSYAAIANRYHAVLAGHDPSILASPSPEPRHPHVLPGTRWRKHAGGGRSAVRQDPAARRGLFGDAKSRLTALPASAATKAGFFA